MGDFFSGLFSGLVNAFGGGGGGGTGGGGFADAIGGLLGGVAKAAAPALLSYGLNQAMGAPTGGVRETQVQTPQQQNAYSQLLSDYQAGQQSPSPLLTDPNLQLVTEQNKRQAASNAAGVGMADSGQALRAMNLATAQPRFQAATTAAQLQTQRAGQLSPGGNAPQVVSPYGSYQPFLAANPYQTGTNPTPTRTPAPSSPTSTLPTPGTSAGNLGFSGGSTATQGDAGPSYNPFTNPNSNPQLMG